MLQVLPAVLLALFFVWLDGRAVVVGGWSAWRSGPGCSARPLQDDRYSVSFFGHHELVYVGIFAVVLNIVVSLLDMGLPSWQGPGAVNRRRP